MRFVYNYVNIFMPFPISIGTGLFVFKRTYLLPLYKRVKVYIFLFKKVCGSLLTAGKSSWFDLILIIL